MAMSDRSWGVLAVTIGVVAACALMPGRDEPVRTQAIVDAYLIAHGMAESYGDAPGADPAVTAQLSVLDQKASAAVRALASAGGGNEDASSRAVAALTDYAATHTAIAR